eukprot:TRINITY_DN13166_c0_g1_i1.p1 TRINITY_DN13166_c0_g1~~TRINITY_DN13166_c0_g1_i1.p1  ORF type:complete len:794 (+),score=277.93 TRINITY_DN13166_c0_g1_i1:82-2463(+)
MPPHNDAPHDGAKPQAAPPQKPKAKPADMTEPWKREIMKKKFKREAKMGRQYVKDKKLGAGAFGEGWRCRDMVNNRMVVVKISHRPLAGDYEEYAAKKEVALMEHLDHPNIVKMYEAWVEGARDEGRLHIAMEYCDGGDLGALIREQYKKKDNTARIDKISRLAWKRAGPYLLNEDPDRILDDPSRFTDISAELSSIAEAAYDEVVKTDGPMDIFPLSHIESWMVQLLWGIWYIHRKRVVHRDIKPDNVFLAQGGSIIKIGDFGISGLQAHTNAPMQTRAGTPLYMAPEMWHDGSYNDRVDVFAVASMLYEMVSLSHPFSGRFPWAHAWPKPWSGSSHRFLRKQLSILSIKPTQIPTAQIEGSIFQLIMTMLRKDQKVRPTAGQALRSIRMQVVSRRVLEIFHSFGEGTDGPNPLVEDTDIRHNQINNPANHIRCMNSYTRFQASRPDAEVLMYCVRSRLSLRSAPAFSAATLGYLAYGDIVEVYEVARTDDGKFMRTQSGWCLTEFREQQLFVVCREDLVCRDPDGITALGAYEPVIKGVEDDLRGALKQRLNAAKGEQRSSSPVSNASPRRASLKNERASPVRAPAKEKDVPPPPPSPLKREAPPPLSPSTPRKAAPKESVPPRTRSPARRPAPVEAPQSQRKANSPARRAVRANQPTRGGYRGVSPVKPRPPSPAKRQASPAKAKMPSPVVIRRNSPAKRQGSPARAPKMDLPKEYRDHLVAVLGADLAKRAVTEYFECWEQLLQHGAIKKGTCPELRAYETQLEQRLGCGMKVIQCLRQCAKASYPASA